MKTKNQGVYILSAESKDLYAANNLLTPNTEGYNCLKANGEINERKFVNVLSYSLDLIRLQKTYVSVYRQNRFSFNFNGKDYSRQVINVTFSYALKTYNKVSKDIYVKNGYSISDLNLIDNVCVQDGQLLAIRVGAEVEHPFEDAEVLGKNFTYDASKKCYNQIGSLPTVLNKAQLREELYEYGFNCNGIHYVRYKRSSGSSRVGKCLFINEALYSRMHRWNLCGLKIKQGDKIDLAAFEAYISLQSSSIIDTLEIRPENFLVIDDVESTFDDRVVAVRYENGSLEAQEETASVTNSIFDGQSMMDVSLFSKYPDKGMLLLRNRFFKSACFNTNIQQWFEDNGIISVSQLNGFTLADKLEDIKVITTPSSIKYLKFGTLQEWLQRLEPTFGIVKYEKQTKYCDGQMVQCHYQLLNTLQLSEQNVSDLLKPNFDYLNWIDKEPAVLRHHIKYPYNAKWPDEADTENDIIFHLLGTNGDFAKTKMYHDFKTDTVRSCVKSFRRGHILINGNYSTLFGNGLEMLKACIGKYDGTSEVGVGKICSTRFEDGQTVLGSRSPHIVAGNVWLCKNDRNKKVQRYFNFSKEIVYVNAIGENIMQRLNGADYDSDTVLLTDNPILIEAAKKNYQYFKVPTCFINAKKMVRYYTSFDKADLDVKTSVNKIGEIVNLSQQLNSLMWDNMNKKHQSIEENLPLYYDICKLAVLSGVEIDKSKKEFSVNSAQEIGILKEKYKIIDAKGRTVKPMFFKTITTENGYKLSKNISYQKFATSMDYMRSQIASYMRNRRYRVTTPTLEFYELVKRNEFGNISGAKYAQCSRIIEMIREAKAASVGVILRRKEKIGQQLERGSDLIKTSTELDEVYHNLIKKLSAMKISNSTMRILLMTFVKNKYPDLHKWLFKCLFAIKGGQMFELLKDESPVYSLLPCEDGEIKLYENTFTKITNS